jgi:hypothetical protein
MEGTQLFLQKTGVNNEENALGNSLRSALRRNRTYTPEAGFQERTALRTRWVKLLRDVSPRYTSQVDDAAHLRNISHISDTISHEFAPILYGERLRIGTSQKALNLYLKFLWCLEVHTALPPHCPIDRIVLWKAGITDAWTKLDSGEKYMQWINRLRNFALTNGYATLPDWELALWNEYS